MQDFLHKIIFALIAGFSEFLPVSAPAHYQLYQHMTSYQVEPLLLLSVHIGCLAACMVCCGKRIKRLRKERKLMGNLRRRRGRQPDPGLLMDGAILRTAALPVVIGYLFYPVASRWISSISALALVLFLGGIILFLPRFFARGNKDGRSLSRLDGLLMGLGGMLGALPGLSRVGCAYTMGVTRGAEHSYTLETVFILSIPAFFVMSCFDVYGAIVAGAGITAVALLGYLLAVLVSFGSGYLAIALIRYFSGKADISAAAHYSWGLALFTLLIYVIVH